MTWYWAAFIGLAAWLSPFLALGAVGAWVTHRRHKTARRSIWPAGRPCDGADERETAKRCDQPPLTPADVRHIEREIRWANTEKIITEAGR